MAVKNKVWNIDVEGIPYKVEYIKNKVIINNGEPVKITKLKKLSGNAVETNYELPIENGDVVLHVRGSNSILSYCNRDCETGEEYVPMTIPKWVWIFVVLHALNFLFLIGGAVGGAFQGGVICTMLAVAADQTNKTGKKVLTCAGIWIVSTVIQVALVMLLFSAF